MPKIEINIKLFSSSDFIIEPKTTCVNPKNGKIKLKLILKPSFCFELATYDRRTVFNNIMTSFANQLTLLYDVSTKPQIEFNTIKIAPIFKKIFFIIQFNMLEEAVVQHQITFLIHSDL